MNYSNSETQYNKFIENTIRPMEMKIESIMTKLIQLVAPEYRFEFIDDHINDLGDRVDAIEKMLKNGLITINEAREKLDMENFTDENADKVIISNQFTLLEDLDLNITTPKNADDN